MGRGGSDLTATTIGAAMSAAHVTLWSDVDGVYTAHPKMVRTARPIAHLNFREAAEMSFYGAKVIHQRSMLPVAEQGFRFTQETPSIQALSAHALTVSSP